MDTHIFSEKMIESMRRHFERSAVKYITYPKFVFLCGKALSSDAYKTSNRGVVESYIKKQSDDVFIVLSEKLWEDSFINAIDLLTFEEFLAEISDYIILFVESPGTFCELGAFAYADNLFGEKLILVVDEKYKGSKSFIMTGPVAKARKNGSEVVYAPLDGGILSSNELRAVLLAKLREFRNIRSSVNRKKQNQDASAVQIGSFVIELLELIRLTQPISESDLIELYKKVKGFSSFQFTKKDGSRFNKEIKYGYILKLLSTVGLIEDKNEMITSSRYNKTQSLMMRYYGKAEAAERNRLICRKYRYKGQL